MRSPQVEILRGFLFKPVYGSYIQQSFGFRRKTNMAFTSQL